MIRPAGIRHPSPRSRVSGVPTDVGRRATAHPCDGEHLPSRPVSWHLVYRSVYRPSLWLWRFAPIARPRTSGPAGHPVTVGLPSGGAGLAPRVKVERPTGRTTLTRGAWPARLALGRWRRDGQASTSATRQPRPGRGVHPGARGLAGGSWIPDRWANRPGPTGIDCIASHMLGRFPKSH